MTPVPHDPVPPSLRDALRRALHDTPTIPGDLDARVLSSASRRLRNHRAHHPVRTLRFAAGGAIAAAVLLSGAAIWFAPVSSPARITTAAAADDINRDGRVDILDAMALALAHNSKNPEGDPDVQSLMTRIVSIGGRS